MNFLILTPDGVGSTILQRLLTMALHLESVRVVNTHELTNGLVLHDGILKKNFNLEYSQKFCVIKNLLENSRDDVKIISRLAKYHIDARKDSLAEQQSFFFFLNNFFHKKITCVRENVFEYAMSWCIRHQSGFTNIYKRHDREEIKKVYEVDENYFLKKCQDYVDYIAWIEKYFPSAESISYEKIIKNSDNVIENLTGYKNTFKIAFGTPLSSILKAEYDLSVLLSSKKKNINLLSKKEQRSLINYKQTSNAMIKKEIIIGNPIKNTTLSDKVKQIKNFNSCLDKFYIFAKNHNWIDQSLATYDFWHGKKVC